MATGGGAASGGEIDPGSPHPEWNDSGASPTASSAFECNICLDTAKDAVVSYCGHLFCWPCLHQWLETRPNRQVCPVCKAAVSRDRVIPLYGRGSTEHKDPRDKLPPRPHGQRTEPEANNAGFAGIDFGNVGLQMSFGIGAFPFTLFAHHLNFSDGRPGPPPPGSEQHREEQILSYVFAAMATLFAVWLLLA